VAESEMVTNRKLAKMKMALMKIEEKLCGWRKKVMKAKMAKRNNNG